MSSESHFLLFSCCFIIILTYKLNIYINLKKKKKEAREPKEANKAYE